MAWVRAPDTDYSLTTPRPTAAIEFAMGASYFPSTARVQWNTNAGNIQKFIPAPGYSDLVNVNPVSYAG